MKPDQEWNPLETEKKEGSSPPRKGLPTTTTQTPMPKVKPPKVKPSKGKPSKEKASK